MKLGLTIIFQRMGKILHIISDTLYISIQRADLLRKFLQLPNWRANFKLTFAIHIG